MQKRFIGKTEIAVSKLGLGTVKFGRNEKVKYPSTFNLPSDKEIENLLNLAFEMGINLLDTAPAYGSSEERLGKLLQGERHHWVISTKVGEEFINGKSFFDFSEKALTQSIERSLKRLKTDYLDVVLVHSNGDDKDIIEKDQVFLTLERLKKIGKIRAFGMSSKTVTGGLQTVNYADVVMVTYHPLNVEDKKVIDYAYENQKGILIKKALASGHLPFTIAESFKFIFKEPGVTSVIVGTINCEHLRENVKWVMGEKP